MVHGENKLIGTQSIGENRLTGTWERKSSLVLSIEEEQLTVKWKSTGSMFHIIEEITGLWVPSIEVRTC